MKRTQIENIEIELLLEGIFRRHGYDFKHYARASLKRRLEAIVSRQNLNHISEILPRVLYDHDFMNDFVKGMSVTVTEMFRDPFVYRAIRKLVIPFLKTFPFIKVWHAGCATGEEVYSMAILLKEEGFYDRTQIYATDFNRSSLRIAQEGIYSIKDMKQFTQNYYKAGGKTSFSNYLYSKYESAKIQDSLKKNILFSHHNLVADGVFGEMNLIICRNVLIYFDMDLQNRVLSLFHNSLCHGGILCLGSKESIRFSSVWPKFEVIAEKEKIFKKKYENFGMVNGTEKQVEI
ncbi:MAG: chemotaxis protein CheR [SAR324 cluster bacterium]|uniref:Chemotaxis protein CheR n=1 Tax=SAR324 cluster bacterium TaxID=2024889 RepID=A0A2A4SSX4_9DELT|nr:MAG: chemotaxis protein CheR [SAR324 cluster bacterium]